MSDVLCTIMLLCQGTEETGQDFWAYVAVRPSMAKAFADARAKGAFELEDYGTIIEYGHGKDVPADVQARMALDYGVNNNYEDLLTDAVEHIKSQVPY